MKVGDKVTLKPVDRVIGEVINVVQTGTVPVVVIRWPDGLRYEGPANDYVVVVDDQD